jgi:hypothetical protein
MSFSGRERNSPKICDPSHSDVQHEYFPSTSGFKHGDKFHDTKILVGA